MSSELSYLTIARAAELIRTRKLLTVELMDALLKRIDPLEPQVNAFITLTASQARRHAQEAECEMTHGRYRGPLHVIPFAPQDIDCIKGILTSGCSKVGLDNVPREDATTTRKL